MPGRLSYGDLMSHLIETMAFVNQTPWHGIGNKLAVNQPIDVWRKQAGMDWDIQEAEVKYNVPRRHK